MAINKMSLLRISNMSVFFKIKEGLSTSVALEQLTRINGNQYKAKYPRWVETIRPEFFIDGAKKTEGIKVDFSTGTVTFDSAIPDTSIVTANYNYCIVDVFDDYPDIDSPEFKTPCVSVVHELSAEAPLELGNQSSKSVRRYYIVDVYAERSGQRDDLAEAVLKLFDIDTQIVDFNLGMPVNGDGTINYNFDKSLQTIECLNLENSINMTVERSISKGNGEKYIMSLDVNLVSYRD